MCFAIDGRNNTACILIVNTCGIINLKKGIKIYILAPKAIEVNVVLWILKFI